MSLFSNIFSILNPDIDIEKGAFEHPVNRNAPINEDFITYSFINSLHIQSANHKPDYKYHCLKNILTNPLINTDKKEFILQSFSKAQSIFLSLNKFARIYKRSKARVDTVEHDLYMNPLADFKDTHLINLFDDETRTFYKFRLADIITMSIHSLSNSPEFFADPQPIKNPYINVPFTYAQLYNIYFNIQNSPFQIPVLFRLYYQSSFNLDHFLENNEAYIRDVAINRFIYSGIDSLKQYYISKMIMDNKHILNNLYIHPSFPQDKLISTFQPFLKDYLFVNYSLNPTAKFRSKVSLRKRLSNFVKLNPTFGRIIILPGTLDSSVSTTYVDHINYQSLNDTPRTRRRSIPDNTLQRNPTNHTDYDFQSIENSLDDVISRSIENTDETLNRINDLRDRLSVIPNANTIINIPTDISSNSNNTHPDISSNISQPDYSSRILSRYNRLLGNEPSANMTENTRTAIRNRLQNSQSPAIQALLGRYLRNPDTSLNTHPDTSLNTHPDTSPNTHPDTIDNNLEDIDNNLEDIDNNLEDIDNNQEDIDNNQEDIDNNQEDIDNNQEDIDNNRDPISTLD